MGSIVSFAIALLSCYLFYLIIDVVLDNLFALFLAPFLAGILLMNMIRIVRKEKDEGYSTAYYNVASVIIWFIVVFSTFGYMIKYTRDYYGYATYAIILLVGCVFVSHLIVVIFKWNDKRQARIYDSLI